MELEAHLEGAGFSGPYQLGQGGSGVVYRARHPQFGAVAVKVLVDDEPKARERFAREAANLARVNHPALVPLLSAGDLASGSPYIVMPFLDGPTVAQRLRSGNRVSLPIARATFERIASALEALHDEGILHRDVKPENVLLTSNGAVLLDLGIAKEDGAAGETTEGAVRGTPRTMAPERMFGAPATRQSDVYELALLLYTLLVGKVPWTADADPLARLAPPPLTATRDDVPARLSDVVLRALSTRPERRPQSIAALVADVAAALSTRPEETETRTHAPSGSASINRSVEGATVIDVVTPPETTPALPAPRRRWVLPAIASAAVLVAAGLAVRTMRPTAPPKPPEPVVATVASEPEPEPEPEATTSPVVADPPPPAPSASAHPKKRVVPPKPRLPHSRFVDDRK